jgi:hypothetical protein
MIERPDSDIVKLVGFNKAQRLKDEADIRIVFGNPEFVGMSNGSMGQDWSCILYVVLYSS